MQSNLQKATQLLCDSTHLRPRLGIVLGSAFGQVVEEVVANIDIAPTVFEAAGIKTPGYMDGLSFIPLGQGKDIPWRDYFLYVYYW